MGFESSHHEVTPISGKEINEYPVPINRFLAENPITGPELADQIRIHTGELQPADETKIQVAGELALHASNLNDILLHAADEDLKLKAAGAVIETVVRIQNPDYTTDHVEVLREVSHVHDAFARVKKRRLEEANKIGNTEDRIRIEGYADPADKLIDLFDEYITGEYDLRAMREKAALTLAPMIKPVVSEDFVEVVGHIIEHQPVVYHREREIGQLAAKQAVGLKIVA